MSHQGQTSQTKLPKIGIVGPGAVGCMLGYYLNQAEFPVYFFGRDGAIDIEFSIEGVPNTLSFPKAQSSVDFFFMAVKSYQVQTAIENHKWLKNTPGAIVCNGLLDEVLKDETSLSSGLWHLGTTTIGVSSLVEKKWKIFNNGGYVVWGGDHNERSLDRIISDKTKKFGFAWSPLADLKRREKWLFNTVINSLCGYFQHPRNGLLLNDLEFLEKMFDESFSLGLELFGAWENSRDFLWDTMIDLIKSTSENENSMVCDIRVGRETENQYLTGLVANSKSNFPTLRKVDARLENINKGLQQPPQ